MIEATVKFGMGTGVDPVQTAPKEQLDLELHCLPRLVC